MIDQDVLEALEKCKKAKKRLNCEIAYLTSILPENVQEEIHYNGHNAKHACPEYSQIIDFILDT